MHTWETPAWALYVSLEYPNNNLELFRKPMALQCVPSRPAGEQAEPCWAVLLSHLCCLLTRHVSFPEDTGVPLTCLTCGKPGSGACWWGAANEKQTCPCSVAHKNGCSPWEVKDFLMLKSLLWIVAGLCAPAGAWLSSHLSRELLSWLAGEQAVLSLLHSVWGWALIFGMAA